MLFDNHLQTLLLLLIPRFDENVNALSARIHKFFEIIVQVFRQTRENCSLKWLHSNLLFVLFYVTSAVCLTWLVNPRQFNFILRRVRYTKLVAHFWIFASPAMFYIYSLLFVGTYSSSIDL